MNYITVEVDLTKCDKCYECVIVCQTNALRTSNGVFIHNGSACSYCETCMDVCPMDCIIIKEM